MMIRLDEQEKENGIINLVDDGQDHTIGITLYSQIAFSNTSYPVMDEVF